MNLHTVFTCFARGSTATTTTHSVGDLCYCIAVRTILCFWQNRCNLNLLSPSSRAERAGRADARFTNARIQARLQISPRLSAFHFVFLQMSVLRRNNKRFTVVKQLIFFFPFFSFFQLQYVRRAFIFMFLRIIGRLFFLFFNSLVFVFNPLNHF